VCCNALQCAAMRCSVLQCVAVCCNALQCAAMRCSVLQCVAVCCSVAWPTHVWYDSSRCDYSSMCDMTHTCVRRDSFTCETWLIRTKKKKQKGHKSLDTHLQPLRCEKWLLHIWDMTHSYHGSFICETCLIHMWDVTPSNRWIVTHESFMCETWLNHICAVTHWHMRHDW